MHPTRTVTILSLLSAFGLGAVVGALYDRPDVIAFVHEASVSGMQSVETLAWRELRRSFDADPAFESEFRRRFQSTLNDLRTIRLRNQVEAVPPMIRILDSIEQSLPAERRNEFGEMVLRSQYLGCGPTLLSFYHALGVNYRELYTLDGILSVDYDKLQDEAQLTPENYERFIRRLIIDNYDDILIVLPREKKRRLEALGTALENLKPVTLDEALRSLSHEKGEEVRSFKRAE